MTRWILAGLMALAALGPVAVFDIDSATAEAAPSASPFAGTYVGADPHGLYRSWTVTISDEGLITSSFFRAPGWRGSITGQVSAGGSYSLKVFVYDRTMGGVYAYASAGTMTSDADGSIVGKEKKGKSFVWLRG